MKTPANWITRSGADSVSTISTSDLLMETGDMLLQETSDLLYLEDNIVSTKEASSWSNPTKNAGAWRSQDGSSSSAPLSTSYLLINTTDFLLLNTAGDELLLGDSTMTPKEASRWTAGDND